MLGLCRTLGSQVFLHQHAAFSPHPPLPSYAYMWTQTQDNVYFEDICPGLCSGKGSRSLLGMSLGTFQFGVEAHLQGWERRHKEPPLCLGL